MPYSGFGANQNNIGRVWRQSISEDLQRSGPVLKRAVDGHPTLCDYVFETELLTYVSMRPIHQICLDMEHVFLAKAYDAVRQFCEPRDISSFVTDALMCHPSKAQKTAFRRGNIVYQTSR